MYTIWTNKMTGNRLVVRGGKRTTCKIAEDYFGVAPKFIEPIACPTSVHVAAAIMFNNSYNN